jgi:hypothetical protein
MHHVKGRVLIQKGSVALWLRSTPLGNATVKPHEYSALHVGGYLHAPSVLFLRKASRDPSDMTDRPEGRSGHGAGDKNSYT